jgi:hypothetical protein
MTVQALRVASQKGIYSYLNTSLDTQENKNLSQPTLRQIDTRYRPSSLSAERLPNQTASITDINTNRIASAKIDLLDDLSIGIGIKTPNGELVFYVPLSSLEAIMAGKPFTASMEIKLKGNVDIGGNNGVIEFQGRVTASFQNINSFPEISGDGYAIVGVENKSDSGNNSTSTYAGVTVKYTAAKGWQFSPTAQIKNGTELGSGPEKQLAPGVSIEGRGSLSTEGNPLIAAQGALGGDQATGQNIIRAGYSGKLSITSPTSPLTVYVRGSGNLTLENDSQNGLWIVRRKVGMDTSGKPRYRTLGSFDLPAFAQKMYNAGSSFFQAVEQNVPGLSQIRSVLGVDSRPPVTNDVGGVPISNGVSGRYSERPDTSTYAQPVKPLPYKILGSDNTLKRKARENPNSTEAYLVRGLNAAVAAPKNNPDFALQLESLNGTNNGITTTWMDERGRTVEMRWSKPQGYLRVEVRRQGEATTYFHKVTDLGNGSFKWTVPTSGGNQNTQSTTPQQPRTPIAQPSKVLPYKILGSDETIKQKAKENPNSTEAYLVQSLNDAVDAPTKNSDFAKQLRALKPNDGGITDIITDAQGRKVHIRWLSINGYLRVEVRRDGDATTYYHQVTALKDGTYKWSKD